jgi:hypothetical protein
VQATHQQQRDPIYQKLESWKSFARPDIFDHQWPERSVELRKRRAAYTVVTPSSGFNIEDGAGTGAETNVKAGAIYEQETSQASHPTGDDAKHRANR